MFNKKFFYLMTIIATLAFTAQAEPLTKIERPLLPYSLEALAPYITENTLDFHYNKHHQGYVDTLNKLIAEKKIEASSLEEIILKSANDKSLTAVFNNAAQTWNHTFYWKSMKKQGGGQPSRVLLEKITHDFGSYAQFREAFIKAGTKVFGSGWVWLILDGDTLKIISTTNADLPLTQGKKALITCDVWEHAYYLDYQNRRKNYVEVFLDHLVNWDFAIENMNQG